MNILDTIAQEIQEKTGLVLIKQTITHNKNTTIHYQTHTAYPPHITILIGIPDNHKHGTHLLIIKTQGPNWDPDQKTLESFFAHPDIYHYFAANTNHKLKRNSKLIDLTHPQSIDAIIQTIKDYAK